MRISFWLVLALLLISKTLWAQQGRILICTPEWENETRKDGTGLYHELWKLIYQNKGFDVKVHYAPFLRCSNGVQIHQRYDSYPAAYKNSKILTPNTHLGVDLLSVAHKIGSTYKNQTSFIKKRVSWERGVEFDNYGIVTAPIDLHEFTTLENALNMLSRGAGFNPSEHFPAPSLTF